MTALCCLFYVSESSTFAASDVTSIADQSQINNSRDDLTGLLLFDGKFFCQYVEGPAAAVHDLLVRLGRDARHHNMRVLQHGPFDEARVFPSWRMGFSYVADEKAIQKVLGADRSRAFETFRAIEHGIAQPKD